MPPIVPTVMVKNEARFIQAVLEPLLTVFGTVIVGDTGSTDETFLLAKATGATVFELGPQNARGLTNTRRRLGQEVYNLGIPWQLQCDGDELYSRKALELVRDTPIPSTMSCGFTSVLTLDEDASGDVWELADQFCRLAVLPSDCKWGGDYPFDSPDCFARHTGFFYYPVPDDHRMHAVHLHRFRRSMRDDEVFARVGKQHQFAMRDATIPRTVRFDLDQWIASNHE